jgi:hypothetical protein
MDGRRQIRRYVPELNAEGIQDLPPEGLQRYAFKMATGSGKTWVMAMAIVWSHFHKRRVPGSDLSTNFLIVAPNVIVYQRLEKDFASNRIFHELPLIPPEWRGTWSQKVICAARAPNLILLAPCSSPTPAAVRDTRAALDATECHRSHPGTQAKTGSRVLPAIHTRTPPGTPRPGGAQRLNPSRP